MRYLHTAFNDAAGLDKPIIHRDLKSPNLLLARTPGPGPQGEVTVKISDFGLSREKEKTQEVGTVMMTGCGSVLWMAPEILLGRRYNEKVDVFSYAMCLVELVDCNLPWAGTATSMEVPNVVTKGRRPDKQLARATDQMRSLIRRCWHEDPSKRPSFTEIVEELTGASVAPVAARSAPVGMSRLHQQQPASLGSVPEDIEHGSLETRLRQMEEAMERERQEKEQAVQRERQEREKAERERQRAEKEKKNCEQSERSISQLQRQLKELREEHRLATSGRLTDSPRRAKMGVSRPASPGGGGLSDKLLGGAE
jgi:serine/threonine protein kinase